ncbi:ankyrin repeat-containing protein [Anaeramoeba flamelloides]|uniref:Ankyrin repeat-containing protein n=1 Tax=Anaeramoeba flamelloides TaxID=1746091 RepID=A0ABQ8Y564_9EUKA|nr:ankyrin repeat-containing protein [Anaeramoeba flamelloides]
MFDFFDESFDIGTKSDFESDTSSSEEDGQKNTQQDSKLTKEEISLLKRGNLEEIQGKFDKAKINFTTKHMKTPLHLVCSSNYGGTETIEYLLEIGCAANSLTDTNNSILNDLLSNFASKKTTSQIDLLVNAGCDPNLANDEGCIPLMSYLSNAQKISSKMLKHLIEKGTKLDLVDHDHMSSLHHLALRSNHKAKHFEILLEKDCSAINRKQRNTRQTPLHLLFDRKLHQIDIKVVELFVKYGADFSQTDLKSETPFHLLSTHIEEDDPVEVFEKYLSFNKLNVNKINNYGQSFLHILCSNKQINHNIIKAVIEKSQEYNLNVNLQEYAGRTCCHLYYIKQKTQIKKEAHEANMELIKSSVEKGLNIFLRDLYQDSLFSIILQDFVDKLSEQSYYLASYNFILFIIQKDPNFNLDLLKGTKGLPFFHFVCQNYHQTKELFRLLIHKDVNVNEICQNTGNNCLHYLMKNQDIAIQDLESILKKGANVNTFNSSNYEPIAYYFKNTSKVNYQICDLFVKYGWNPNKIDSNNSKLLMEVFYTGVINCDLINYLYSIGYKFESYEILTEYLEPYYKKNILDFEIFELLMKYSKEHLPQIGEYTLKKYIMRNNHFLEPFYYTKYTSDAVEISPKVIKLIVKNFEINIKKQLNEMQYIDFLLYNIDENKINVMEFLLKSGLNPNLENRNSLNGLHLTAKHSLNKIDQQLIMFKLLIDYGCDYNKFNNKHKTPLMYLLSKSISPSRVIDFYIKNNLDLLSERNKDNENDNVNSDDDEINKKSISKIKHKNKSNELHYLCKNGSALESDIQHFLDLGLDINAQNHKKESPLIIAIKKKNYNPAIVLFKFGSDLCVVDNNGDTPLILMCRHLLYFSYFYKYISRNKDLDVNIRNNLGYSPLLELCKNYTFERKKMLRLLIDLNANLNFQENRSKSTASHFILSNYLPYMLDDIKLFITKGVDLSLSNKDGLTPIHCLFSSKNGELDFQIIDVLYTYCKDLFLQSTLQTKQSILHLKIRNSILKPLDQKLLDWIIEIGVDINAKDDQCKTILHYICENNNSTSEQFLWALENGANVNDVTSEGTSILHSIAKRNSQKMDFLLSALKREKINVNLLDAKKNSVLHLICYNTANIDAQLVHILIKKGFNINQKNIKGDTPLSILFREKLTKKILQTIEIFLRFGATPNFYLNPNGFSTLSKLFSLKITPLSLIKKFIKNNSQLSIIEIDSNTPLHTLFANFSWENINKIKYILTLKPDFNIKNKYGETPLRILVSRLNIYL